MKKTIGKEIIVAALVSLVSMTAIFARNEIVVYAKDMTVNVPGKLLEFDEKSEYIYSSGTMVDTITDSGKLGTFSLSGDIKSVSDVNGFKAYQVQHTDVVNRENDEGIVKFSYILGNALTSEIETDWHIVEDKTKEVNGEKLDEKIQNGAVIVQTSLDGQTWNTDVTQTDIVDEESGYKSNFYNTKGIQQVNGCFYRVAVVYKTEKRLEDTKIGPVSRKHYEYKKYAEIYEFYLIDSLQTGEEKTLPTTTPRKELGATINTGKDNGFSGNEPITDKDPHFGWGIGTFYLNGYTREQSVLGNEDSIFLKTVGDRVTLWFNLKENISCLNGKDNLSINEDKNGYDQYFGIKESNFRHGALIIQFTDFEGKKHVPVIYTDYLAACAKTGANTKVELFEEGDYEVALDYEIKDSSGFIDSYTDYRISFQFKIRNGNCMVYPFDVVTGAELSDNALTENGFKLDMAKSRYLTVDIERCAIRKENERYSLDTRVNTATHEGESYTTEGVYIFTVKNPSTGESTTKTVYVGNSPIYRALASGQTIEHINELLDQGGQIQDDGSIFIPVPEEQEEIVETELEEKINSENVSETETTADEMSETMSMAVTNEAEADTETVDKDLVLEQEEFVIPNTYAFIAAGVVVAVLILWTIGRKRNSKSVDIVDTDVNIEASQEEDKL